MRIAALLLTLPLLSAPAISLAQQVANTVYSIQANGSYGEITAGPDGAVWFPEPPNKIGRITTAGVITSYLIPDAGTGEPNGIAAGPDGALWFTMSPNKIGRITTAGAVTQYRVPGRNNMPWYITAGPDGAMWFTQFYGNEIGRITTAGVITMFPLPSPGSDGLEITSGPDGALWFTELDNNAIGRITTAGVATEYSLPTPQSDPWGITAGPDGALWFTEEYANKIGRITTAGVLTEYPLPNGVYPYEAPEGITAGPDGALWFMPLCCQTIARITTAGAFSYYPVEGTKGGGNAITTGPDGGLWFTTNGAGQVGDALFVTATLSVTPNSGDYRSELTFVGTGYAPNETVQVYSSGVGSAVVASSTTDSTGRFTAVGGVPESAVGPRFLLGAGQTSGKLGAASFSVTARLYLDPYYGTPGSTASVIGYGFGPFETVSIFWDNGSTALGTVTADRYGTFKGTSAFTLTIPSNAAPGTYTVTATETYPAASASAIYTVD
jgi:streptogramin lyase